MDFLEHAHIRLILGTITLFLIFLIAKVIGTKVLKKICGRKRNIISPAISILQKLNWFFFAIISFYIVYRTSEVIFIRFDFWIELITYLIVTYYIIKGIFEIVNFATKEIDKRRKKEDGESDSLLFMLSSIVKGIVVVIALIFILSNSGYDVTSLVAGLGIGGIAIAFAMQNILEDIFSSFSIYLDKPFRAGDFIIVGADMGTVKHVGIKTTRMQTLQGQELIIPNKELTKSRINNYKRMEQRRIVFNFGITYQTPSEKIKKIPGTIEKIIESIEQTRFDRAHFFGFGDSSLNFEVVYFVESKEYTAYMNIQQEINLKMMEEFEKEKIEFAYPTRTIYLNQE